MLTEKPKIISIHEVSAKTTPYLFVINESEYPQNNKITRGAISIPLKTANGSIMLRIPNTWIPIDLSLMAKKEMILDDLYFRNTLNNGDIAIVDEDWARKTLDTDDAKMEAQRLLKARNISATQLQAVDFDDKKPPVNSLVIEFLGGTVEENTKLDENDLYASLLNNAKSFNESDWQYVVENTSFEKVKELAVRNLNSNK